MILTTHALAGAVIGKNLNNPWLIIALVIPLHYIMDHFRHGEYLNKQMPFRDNYWKVALDIATGLGIIGAVIFFKNFDLWQVFLILLGAFFSMFPDLLTLLYWKFNVEFLKKPYQLHKWVHKFPSNSPESQWNLRNAANDIIFSVLAIFLLLI
ncbi:hypothetical protein J7J13_01805 [bacterium]|nr:hypothetical protein [bacterium]